MDCGCCCETVTMPRMTHCDGDEPHFFCLDCARKNANNDIGNSQYKLRCMDFSGCIATFSREQRLRFLDEKTMAKLERLQQQQELRSANLDNLSTCPFCDFAAICPPIGEDREFRCHNLECQEVSPSPIKLIFRLLARKVNIFIGFLPPLQVEITCSSYLPRAQKGERHLRAACNRRGPYRSSDTDL